MQFSVQLLMCKSPSADHKIASYRSIVPEAVCLAGSVAARRSGAFLHPGVSCISAKRSNTADGGDAAIARQYSNGTSTANAPMIEKDLAKPESKTGRSAFAPG
jgi:hypothetical protein